MKIDCFGTHAETNEVCQGCTDLPNCIAVQKKYDRLAHEESVMKADIDRLTRELAEERFQANSSIQRGREDRETIERLTRESVELRRQNDAFYLAKNQAEETAGKFRFEVERLRGLIAGWVAEIDRPLLCREMREAAKGEKW